MPQELCALAPFAQVVVLPVEESANQTASSAALDGQQDASSSTHLPHTGITQEDATSLIQHTGAMISFRHSQHLLPVDLDQSMPTCAEQMTHLHQEGHIPTVSQSTAALNQYESITNDDVCPIMPTSD